MQATKFYRNMTLQQAKILFPPYKSWTSISDVCRPPTKLNCIGQKQIFAEFKILKED